MKDWHVGQKIVCINVGEVNGIIPPQVKQHLVLGDIYTIREIMMYEYRYGELILLAFYLKGIIAIPTPLESKNRPNIKEYAFWSGRFKPLEEIEKEKPTGEMNFLLNPCDAGDNDIEKRKFKERKRVKKKELVPVDMKGK